MPGEYSDRFWPPCRFDDSEMRRSIDYDTSVPKERSPNVCKDHRIGLVAAVNFFQSTDTDIDNGVLLSVFLSQPSM